jgi:hypothetical protein
MPDTAPGNRGRDRQKIPRIQAREAAQIYDMCAHLDETAGHPLIGLRTAGFDGFLARLEESILGLAVQPDSWGERTKACLIAEIISHLTGTPVASWSTPEIAEISNVLIPCFLLELGRRYQHVQVEFPRNPCEATARFEMRAGLAHPTHSITKKQLVRLAMEAGEELVGLCYFGDHRSRTAIESRLAFEGDTTNPGPQSTQ